VNSPLRAFRNIGITPVSLERGRGAMVTDVAGRRYVDFIMGWGPLIFGHNPPAVVRAVREQTARGILMGLTHPGEAELAALIADAVPSVEQVRLTVSGSEACMTAVRLARAVTRRAKILTFDGCYHGHGESLIAPYSAGLPKAWARDVLTVPFNDPAAVEAAFTRYGDELACVIVEPVAANMGVVAPAADFLPRLRPPDSANRGRCATVSFDRWNVTCP